MAILTKEQRNQLSRVVLKAREIAEAAAKKALRSLGVGETDAPSHLSPENRILRRALRAQARQLGDKEDYQKKGSYDLYHLSEKIAYDQWHRMLFARFLAENDLLIAPDHGVPVSLQECRELAPEMGLKDEWDVAVRFAAKGLPQIFRPDDPVGKIELAPEDRVSLRDLVIGLPRDTFLADDSLGWSYQFWQTERKSQVNESGNKIGADELPAVTQLFTEDYMVDFLLDNTLGAWHAGKVLSANSTLAENAQSEDELRNAVSLPNCQWKYLRFIKNQDDKWTPAAGTFDGWPKAAEELRCLDPCMGSGHFVVAMFHRLVAVRMAEGLEEKEAVGAVIRDNLYGSEIDPRCTQIAAFNLALAAWRRVGHCALPAMNLACSGLAPNAKLEDWLKIAGDNQKLQRGMERLYGLFQKAPLLGALINPSAHEGDLLVAEFHELQPLLEKALAQEAKDDTAHEMAATAHGLAKAAEILASQFTLVATNVPYLGRGKQDEVLADYCERSHPDGKADLATVFLSRSFDWLCSGGAVALVTPQTWLFLTSYRKLRERLLRRRTWNAVVRLGSNAFRGMNWWAATTALVCITKNVPRKNNVLVCIDTSADKSQDAKADMLRGAIPAPVALKLQEEQLANPDFRITFSDSPSYPLVGTLADFGKGCSTGDADRFVVQFWELARLTRTNSLWLNAPKRDCPSEGRRRVTTVPIDAQSLREQPGCRIHGQRVWNRKGIAFFLMNKLISFVYEGEVFDNIIGVLVPHNPDHLPALWCWVHSGEFLEAIREVDQKAYVTPATLSKVPFDVHHWQARAIEEGIHSLPELESDDPTIWLFRGRPDVSTTPLQVAVARLLGYRWPRQTGSSFPDCPTLEPDDLEKLADDDGIVCINPIKGEQPAAERLRALLAAAFGTEWTAGKQNELLGQVKFGGKTLEDWLRNGFFEQHCQLFHQRPFIWQIWDGGRDGFSVLVNYHKLNRSNLEKVTYTFLGDWIARQKAANDAGEEGSDARLQAAQELKSKLEKIIEGEDPFDIFVRWKPIEKQPIGWEPDLNDGARLNIRPFVIAGVLRKNPNINWNKDRGKDVGSAPWYNKYDLKRIPSYKAGDRINDYHLNLEEKRKARNKA